ncbi:hypothetical protein ISF_04665 [Cordyceps fumosorosea ARSEF 2679]|uniref:Uncharacterized protein n=1 Tax=Cordyceps fumosorosea (strain ARSEF 2679) TaxID=1081104 RepID=A0A167WLZ2_CORFA|nr:hypothetical protein ISF_04665 [Cordyceps fumosorosea ARSEF 2679]OAA63956.1 hypothetical protein ISF_04665 [Cordyceps fumosorosea ARSEF 2679]
MAGWYIPRNYRPEAPMLMRLGIIFLDRHPEFWNCSAACRFRLPSSTAGTTAPRPPARRRNRLLECMRHNDSLHTTGAVVPAPLIVVEDLHRLVAHEWAHLATYFTRVLNAIEWALQRGGGH